MISRRTCSVLAALGAASIPDAAGLLQTGRAVDYVGPQFELLMGESVNLDDEATVTTLHQQMVTMTKDLKVAMDTDDNPYFRTGVTDKDFVHGKELCESLSVQIREAKMLKMPIWPVHKVDPKPNVTRMREFVTSMRSKMYSEPGTVAHVIANNHAFCIEGPAFYTRKVLYRFRKSPLRYGFDGIAHIKEGDCEAAGFTEVRHDFSESCFKQATVKVRPESKLFSKFSKQMALKWKIKHHKTDEDVMWEMQHICLDD